MNEYTFPANDLDRPKALMALLGSFWTESYLGSDLVMSLCAARLAAERQLARDTDALVAAVSRHDCPILHAEDWHPLAFRRADVNGVAFTVPTFSRTSGRTFEANGGLLFGRQLGTSLFAWPLPPEMVDCAVITNRIANPSLTLIRDIDFIVEAGHIVFASDPFENPLVPQRAVMVDNEVIDRELGLWAFAARFDRRTVYRQFGYVMRLNLASTPEYKALLNALFDALVEGSTDRRIREAWAAVTGVPLVRNARETVVLVRDEGHRKLVVTDVEAYAYPSTATVTVAEGDVVLAGQPLTDALTFYDFNRGQCPSYADVKALALGRGMLAAGFFGDLVFENRDVPLVIESDADGMTKVSFEVDGWPGDVEKFFDDLHARGIAAGETLAHLLDRRPADARDTEPTAGALPTTVNPLKFLCQNVLRHNAFMVKVRTKACQGGAGMNAAKSLRAVLPPQTVMIVIAELVYADEPVKMDGPGDETTPGYTESVTTFVGNRYAETLGVDKVTERVKLRQIAGRCV